MRCQQAYTRPGLSKEKHRVSGKKIMSRIQKNQQTSASQRGCIIKPLGKKAYRDAGRLPLSYNNLSNGSANHRVPCRTSIIVFGSRPVPTYEIWLSAHATGESMISSTDIFESFVYHDWLCLAIFGRETRQGHCKKWGVLVERVKVGKDVGRIR